MVFFIFLLAFINFNTMRLLFLFVGLRICPSDFCRTQNLSEWFLSDSEFIRVIFVGLRIYPSDFCGTRSRHDWVGAPVPSVSLNLCIFNFLIVVRKLLLFWICSLVFCRMGHHRCTYISTYHNMIWFLRKKRSCKLMANDGSRFTVLVLEVPAGT